MKTTKTAILMEVYTGKFVEEIETTSYKKAYEHFRDGRTGNYIIQYDWRRRVVNFK